jgi:hypothetical protein
MLYGTTPEFLERTGLKSVADLPSLAPFLGGSTVAEQDPAVVGERSGEPEEEEPGGSGPDAPAEPAETETEGARDEPEPDQEPGEPRSPGSPHPDRPGG